MGRRRLRQRQGASKFELRFALIDTIVGMTFSEIVAYFIILNVLGWTTTFVMGLAAVALIVLTLTQAA